MTCAYYLAPLHKTELSYRQTCHPSSHVNRGMAQAAAACYMPHVIRPQYLPWRQQAFVQGGSLKACLCLVQVRAGLKAIYCSGWQVAGDANAAGDVYPDQSLYPANSVPEVVRKINKVSCPVTLIGPSSFCLLGYPHDGRPWDDVQQAAEVYTLCCWTLPPWSCSSLHTRRCTGSLICRSSLCCS